MKFLPCCLHVHALCHIKHRKGVTVSEHLCYVHKNGFIKSSALCNTGCGTNESFTLQLSAEEV